MTTKVFSEALNELDSKYIEKAANYRVKKKRRAWIRWGAAAACICLVALAAITQIKRFTGSKTPTDYGLPLSLELGDRVFMESSYSTSADTLPEGFSASGQVKLSSNKVCPYYTNPEIPEWVYVCLDSDFSGNSYVRYVDERLRSRKLLSCGDSIYISLWTANLYETPDISPEYKAELKAKYGLSIEGEPPAGFELAGVAQFTGYDTVPKAGLAMNTDAAEVYLSKAQPEIALVATKWYTAPETPGEEDVLHCGFDVYVRYDCPFSN